MATGAALYAGGEFTLAGGAAAKHVARLSAAGWSGVAGGTDDAVTAFAQRVDVSGPALLVGGKFVSAGGLPAAHVARWGGASWTAFGKGLDESRLRARSLR